MKNSRTFCKCVSLCLAFFLVFSGCAATRSTVETTPVTIEAAELLQEVPAATTSAETTTDTEPAQTEIKEQTPQKTLSVAVYSYIPDVKLFKEILVRQWSELEPAVDLDFVEWNCYAEPEPSQIDIMMYDALFTSYLAEMNYIQPVQPENILNKDGILPFAVEGAHHNGKLYGIPYLVCTDFLVHFSDDEEMAAVQNMTQLCEEISLRKQNDIDDGLVISYNSHYPFLYLDALDRFFRKVHRI